MQFSVKNIILHISLIDGIGPATIWYLIRSQSTRWQWEDLYNFSVQDWVYLIGLKQHVAEKIVVGLKDREQLDQELYYIAKYKVNWLTGIDEEYPLLLAEIHLPPPILYWQGDVKKDEKNIAVIGSRNANYYGERVISKIIPDLIAQNVTIVSGGALGADSMAHTAALANNGKTIAILGSGLMHYYPRSNQRLFDEILASGGAIVSSFAMNMQPKPGNFPARNRIIAGMSYGCIVVQAAKKSGARITAQYALEQGREVFAIPGPIDDQLSIGCHELIKEGATLINSADDIRQELAWIYTEQGKEKNKQVENKRQEEKQDLAEKETSIQLQLIKFCTTPQSMDELLQQTVLNLSELQQELINLQLIGKIQQDFTGRWLAL